MRDAFKSKGNSFGNSQREAFMPTFQFEDGMGLPVQILNPPDNIFEGGFPEVKRHWIEGVDKDGKPKVMPPIACTSGKDFTGGNCMVCYGKATGVLKADRGNASPSVELIIPVYDHTKYRKVEEKFRPINPAMPTYDAKGTQAPITGGLKIMYASESQYRALRTEHDNLQNECKACGNVMVLESLACEQCSAPVYEAQQLAGMTQDEYNRVRYSKHTCGVCQHNSELTTNRACQSCGATESKTLYDVVIYAGRSNVPSKNGKTRKEYKFSKAGNMPLAVIEDDELQAFWTRLKSFVDSGMTIQQQAEKLNIQPPKEWLQTQPGSQVPARPYGQQ